MIEIPEGYHRISRDSGCNIQEGDLIYDRYRRKFAMPYAYEIGHSVKPYYMVIRPTVNQVTID